MNNPHFTISINSILNFLSDKPDQYFKAEFLCDQFGIAQSELRLIVHQLRVLGNPIVANRRGYTYTTNTDVIERNIASLTSRCNSMYEALNGLQNYIDEMERIELENQEYIDAYLYNENN